MISEKYQDASNVLRTDYPDAEDFIKEVFRITEESTLIAKKYPLNYRYSLAHELLLKILKSHWTYKPVGTYPQIKKEEEEKSLLVVEQPEKTEINDYYAILGVDRKASAEEIKDAYRTKLKELHPDITGEESDDFLAVIEAGLILNIDKNKKPYDELLKNSEKPEKATGLVPTVIIANPPSAKKPEIALLPSPKTEDSKKPDIAKLPEPKNPFLDIVFTPNANVPQKAIKDAASRAQRFIKNFSVEGYQAITQNDYGNLKAAGFPIEEFSGTEIPIALELFQKGATTEHFGEQIDSLKNISDEERQHLNRVNFVINALEEEYPKQARIYRTANSEPSISIQEISSPPKERSPRRVVLRRDPNGIFRSVFDAGYGKIKGKAKNFALNALKNSGIKLIKQGVATAGKALLTKLGIAGVASIVGGPVGWAAIALTFAKNALSWVQRKLKGLFSGITKWLFGDEDNAKRYAKLSALVGIGLFLVGIPVGGLIFLGLAGIFSLAALGGLTIVAGITGIGQAMLFGFTTVVPASLGPILITIIGIPFVAFIILFIINTSAYMVPPGVLTGGEGVISPYIDVKKEASPPGPFENDTGVKITYTITITAKKETLTNLVFKYDCKVSSEANKTCPAIDNIQAGLKSGTMKGYSSFQNILNDIKLISPADPLIITYDVNYGAGLFNDSLITDTFTVQATAIDISVEGTGNESIIFGKPPTGCFAVVDNAVPWSQAPSNVYININAAVTNLVANHPNFAAKVCSGNWDQVNLCYDPPAVSIWGLHSHTADCDIKFDVGGLQSATNALYILTHEASHHLQRSEIMPQLQSQYAASEATTELPLCTYGGSDQWETFPEGNALYVQLPSDWIHDCTSGTFQSKYPKHYDFAKNIVFQE